MALDGRAIRCDGETRLEQELKDLYCRVPSVFYPRFPFLTGASPVRCGD